MSTTIRLKDETVRRLFGFGAFKETYDDVVNRLLDACEVIRSVKRGDESLADAARRLVREAKSKEMRIETVASPV
jgi:predicted CopG family antitoxin